MNRLCIRQRDFIKKMRQVFIAASFFIPLSIQAQDTLRIDLAQALEIALSENPTIKVANQEIEKKRYAHKGTLASLFPQINYSADYSRTLKKQVMYMDFDMGDMGGMGGEATEGISQADMDKGFEVGRSNNWSTGINASMPLINASLWKSLRISATDVELAVEQARSSKLSMINQVKKGFYAVLLAHDSYVVFKQSYDNAMENYLDIKRKYEQGTVAEYDLIRADVTVKNTETQPAASRERIGIGEVATQSPTGHGLGDADRLRGSLGRLPRVAVCRLYGDRHHLGG